MDFQGFKEILEQKFEMPFELLEYKYMPYHFGSGMVAYRVNGYNIRLTYDGRDNLLTIERSNHHEKYTECNWHKVFEQTGLGVDNFMNVLFV